jgi:hypothetical protein
MTIFNKYGTIQILFIVTRIVKNIVTVLPSVLSTIRYTRHDFSCPLGPGSFAEIPGLLAQRKHFKCCASIFNLIYIPSKYGVSNKQSDGNS